MGQLLMGQLLMGPWSQQLMGLRRIRMTTKLSRCTQQNLVQPILKSSRTRPPSVPFQPMLLPSKVTSGKDTKTREDLGGLLVSAFKY